MKARSLRTGWRRAQALLHRGLSNHVLTFVNLLPDFGRNRPLCVHVTHAHALIVLTVMFLKETFVCALHAANQEVIQKNLDFGPHTYFIFGANNR